MLLPIRIIMADDHELFRDGFAGMIKENQDMELVDQAPNGAFLVRQVEQLRPDVVVTDIKMETMDGVDATRIICKQFPGTRVIGLSVYDTPGRIREMLDAGAIGYLNKNAT